MSTLKPGCTARVLDVPGSDHFAGRLVEVKKIAQEHACKRFAGEGAYVRAPGFGWWFPVECLEWVSDAPPVWPPRYDEEEEDLERIGEAVYRLLDALAVETHAKIPGWAPLDTIEGQLSQIDNIAAGLLAENARLRGAVLKFGRHDGDCDADYRGSIDTCNCGWWREGLCLADPTAAKRIAAKEKRLIRKAKP